VTRIRLICAALIIPAILGMVWLDYWLGTPDSPLERSGVVLLVCCLAVGFLASSEVMNFQPAANGRVSRPWTVPVATLVLIAIAFIPLMFPDGAENCPVGDLGWLAFGMAAATGLAFACYMIKYRNGDHVTDSVSRTIMIAGYVGLLLAFWAPIRAWGDNAWGIVALLSLLVPVKASDSMAYTAGVAWGRRKLVPQLSPGKTVEGLLGGFAGGILGTAIVMWMAGPWITGQPAVAPWWAVLLFGIAVTAAGIVGDLAESMLKRDGGVKNSSRWLPGLGGIMDMIDSLLAAGPVVLAFWYSGVLGPVADTSA
jgi:phosphatidate cytidylyltransferase